MCTQYLLWIVIVALFPSPCIMSLPSEILAAACAKASKNYKYDSTLIRTKISEEFEARTGGKHPYDWQLNVAEALLLGLGCIVVASTGAGKTMPFIMPLLAEPMKQVIIISPLDSLEHIQVYI